MDQEAVGRDDGPLAQSAKMIAACLISAILSATLVVAVGQSVIERQGWIEHPSENAVLIHARG